MCSYVPAMILLSPHASWYAVCGMRYAISQQATGGPAGQMELQPRSGASTP